MRAEEVIQGSSADHAEAEAPEPLEGGTEQLPLFADKRGRVTYIDHIDARGSLLPSQRRAGAVRVAPKRRTVHDVQPTPSTLAKGGARLLEVSDIPPEPTVDASRSESDMASG
jgi:hypothetical protein